MRTNAWAVIAPRKMLRLCRKIVDDHYEHALRLYRDRDSGGIRLQASVLRGDLKRWSSTTSASVFYC